MSQEIVNIDEVVDPFKSSALWIGEKPCYLCGGRLHSKWEHAAANFVCAGCFNEFAEDCGWVVRR
jgi:hypothetical protein